MPSYDGGMEIFMKLYTKNGDGGKSSVSDGIQREKSDIIFEALGAADELSSAIGLARAADSDKLFYVSFEKIQKKLMRVMAGISLQDSTEYKISDREIAELEAECDRLVGDKSFSFILSGDSELSARIDFARTLARRAERRIASAKKKYTIDGGYIKYINRLSDYLYAAEIYVSVNTNQ